VNGWQNIELKTRAAPGRAPGRAVVLPVNCTLREIAALHDCLRSVSQADALDGSAVQRIDSAGMRLLVAFIRERRAAGCAIGWRAASSALTGAVVLLGLATAINLPSGKLDGPAVLG
jgi:ABC-type transporter Mla MlaB component